KGDTGSPVAKPSIQLTATLRASTSSLAIDYHVVNTDHVPVVLFTGVPARETPERPTVDPNAVYVTASGATVEVSKRLFPVPDGVHPAAYATVRGVVVAPGAAFAEHVVVPLPLQVRVPYAAAMKHPPTLPDSVRTVRFCVGAARQDQVHPVPADSPDGDPRPGFTHAPGGDRRQQATC